MREAEAEVYVNGNADGGGGGGGGGSGNVGGNGSDDDDDEEECKLSIVQELPELNADTTASPPMSLAICQRERNAQGEIRCDFDQVMDFPRSR